MASHDRQEDVLGEEASQPSVLAEPLRYQQNLIVFVTSTRTAPDATAAFIEGVLAEGWEIQSQALGIDDHQVVLSVLLRRPVDQGEE